MDLSTAGTIIDKIRAAKRPVINAGNGIRIAGAHDLFMDVAEKLGVCVITGWDSEDIMYDTHPVCGPCRQYGDRPGNFAIQNSDLVLSIGSRLSIRQVGYNFETWAREAYVIVNDIDEEELKKPSVRSDMRVHADAKDLLEQLNLVLDRFWQRKREISPRASAVQAADRYLTEERPQGYDMEQNLRHVEGEISCYTPKHFAHTDEEPANVYAFIHAVSSRLKRQVTVVGNGSACVVGDTPISLKRASVSSPIPPLPPWDMTCRQP